MTSFQSIDIIQLKGSECFTFLNNQAISKIEPASAITCSYSSICNPKGRILFSFFVILHKNQIEIAINNTMSEELLMYLNMRRFRMDVQIERLDGKTLCMIEGGIKKNQYPLVVCDKSTDSTSEEIWPTLFSWGLPFITKSYQEKHIPQHVNLDQLNVIDFKKGCYPGQEIIARLHFLGEVKKRMQLIHVNPNNTEEPNTPVNGKIVWCSDAHEIDGKHLRQAVVS
ncbi:YgfZ/GcvT domain-containing protein [Marinicella rhabdoformis]|uniref:CAF17-like 4Fe-4S cluster assembly/insertion protein YgfZ n=1 Tax=Marinicella rhabdoformis TaxID=2580566 RepID=UPI0012AED8B0|nr:hypothetical protein [Marinicella rhabdoformis]